MSKYIVKTSSASMPASCWGMYGRIGVLEVDDDVDTVDMISDRARGVIRVVETWEKLNIGKTSRCAFNRAMVEAQQLCDELNTKKVEEQ